MGIRNLLLFLLLLAKCNAAFSQSTPLYKDKSQPIEKRVQDLLSRMTQEEKFWQLFMIPGDLDNVDSLQYKNGIFGFQVSAAGKGDAGGQILKIGRAHV